MCIVYCVIIAVIAAAACGIAERSWEEFFSGVFIFGLTAVLIGGIGFGLLGSSIAGEVANIDVVEKTTYEIVSLNEVFGESYSENDYVLYRDNHLIVYTKDDDGVIQPQKLTGTAKICFSDLATKGFISTELKDFTNDFLRHFFFNPNSEYYVIEVPTGSTIIPYGDMFVKEAA